MKNFLAAVVIIIAMFTVYLAYHGLFAGVEITEKTMGPHVFAYDTHIGPYKDSGEVADRIYRELLKEKVEATRGFGIYYDKPEEVEAEKLRSIAGCLLDEKHLKEVPRLEKKMKIGELPRGKYIYAEFPFKGKMSMILGIFKVYPQMGEYLKEKGYGGSPAMEIYDVPNKRLYYLMSVTDQNSTYEGFLK